MCEWTSLVRAVRCCVSPPMATRTCEVLHLNLPISSACRSTIAPLPRNTAHKTATNPDHFASTSTNIWAWISRNITQLLYIWTVLFACTSNTVTLQHHTEHNYIVTADGNIPILNLSVVGALFCWCQSQSPKFNTDRWTAELSAFIHSQVQYPWIRFVFPRNNITYYETMYRYYQLVTCQKWFPLWGVVYTLATWWWWLFSTTTATEAGCCNNTSKRWCNHRLNTAPVV